MPHLTRDASATVVAALGSLAWTKIWAQIASQGLLDQKLTRKIVHISSGLLFVLTWPLFSDHETARFFAAAVPLSNGIRLFAIGSGTWTHLTLTLTL